jgi:subtilase family serine protease
MEIIVKRLRVSLPVAAAASVLLALSAPAVSAVQAAAGMTPSIERGPKAAPAHVHAAPGYGLFNCQIGLSTGQCYDPYQMRHAYGIDALISAGFTGSGRTVVIVDAFQSPNIVSQLNTYDSFYGLPGLNGLGNPNDPSLGTFTQVAPDGLTPFVPGDANMTGWAEEISLDVLWAHAIAPGANVTLVLAKTNNDSDILSATKYAVDHNLGDVLSQSFGENENCVDPQILSDEHNVFSQATRKGWTIFASSGDQGAAQQTCDGNSWTQVVSSPASDPLVTGVGGTELHAADYCLTQQGCDPSTHPTPGTYQTEIVWNEGPTGDFQSSFAQTEATGGGYSGLFGEPAYQKSSIHGKQRGVPDVSYNAAILHGVLTYLDIPGVPTGYYRFGGTSAGSPQWSALIAIADQKAGKDLGFINTSLYHLSNSGKKYAAAFFDITSGNNDSIRLDSSNNPVSIDGFDAGPGWDATTGLGSPDAVALVKDLIQTSNNGNGTAAIAGSRPRPHADRPGHGHQHPH